MNPLQTLICQVFNFACLIVACLFSLSFIYIAIHTLSYPFNIEWMEGHTIDIIQRIQDGKALYVKPSLEYVPYIYTPLYFYVSAFVSEFTGVGFFPARLVSFLAALGSAAVLYLWVRKEDGSRSIALIGSGLFLGTYILSSRWFDMARIDSLYLLLVTTGLYLCIFHQNARYAFIAAAVLVAAFLTKQSTLLVSIPFFAMLLLAHRKHALKTLTMYALGLWIAIAILNIVSERWFLFYIFEVPSGHQMHWDGWFNFIKKDFLIPCGFMCLMAIGSLVLLAKKDRKKAIVYLGVCAGLGGAAYIARLHSFGWHNNLMPAHWVLALMSALCLSQIKSLQRFYMAIAVYVLIGAQFWHMQYNPKHFIPTELQKVRGELFVKELAKIKGDVFIPDLQWVPTMAGKKSYNYGMAAFDLMRAELGEKNYIKENLSEELKLAVENKQFDAIIPAYTNKVRIMHGHYERTRKLPPYPHFLAGAYRRMPIAVFTPLPQAIPREPDLLDELYEK